MSGKIVHFEIPFEDGDRARALYADTFGWQVMEMPEDDSWAVIIAFTLLVAFAGFLVRWYWVAGAGAALTFLGLARWLWPVHAKVLETEA